MMRIAVLLADLPGDFTSSNGDQFLEWKRAWQVDRSLNQFQSAQTSYQLGKHSHCEQRTESGPHNCRYRDGSQFSENLNVCLFVYSPKKG